MCHKEQVRVVAFNQSQLKLVTWVSEHSVQSSGVAATGSSHHEVKYYKIALCVSGRLQDASDIVPCIGADRVRDSKMRAFDAISIFRLYQFWKRYLDRARMWLLCNNAMQR